jgi:hypothetical protein
LLACRDETIPRMDTTQILAEIDAEIESLKQAKAILTGTTLKRGPGRPKGTPTPVKQKRKMSPEGRARLVAALKARWAKSKGEK